MEQNATYEFRLTSIYGNPALMVVVGPVMKPINKADDGSYNYVKEAFEPGDNIAIRVDAQMRRSISPQCANGTFPLRGGFDRCTMYVAVQCPDICAYNISAVAFSMVLVNNTLRPANQTTNASVI